ncbi:MAG: flagellar filament capping protein FliD [Spirochaetaceae bacterium]|jgi:flagellar hook-associated protein 2|nr:flagellar filament capping protein FliD [Spirochaetaceae bacterium]
MADISIPGIKSRFDTDKTIEGLMELERVPKKRIEKAVEVLQLQKSTWQTLGRRISALRDGANQLYSYQNPFNEKSAASSDTSVLEANVTREARGQSHDFVVKQSAASDKFISNSLDKDYRVPAGNYKFMAGETTFEFKYSGGSLQEFADAINRRSEGKFSASVVAVKRGTSSFVVGSEISGAENRLSFADDALKFAVKVGLVKEGPREPRVTAIDAVPVSGMVEGIESEEGGSLKVSAGSKAEIDLAGGIKSAKGSKLSFEISFSTIPSPQDETGSVETAGDEPPESEAAADEITADEVIAAEESQEDAESLTEQEDTEVAAAEDAPATIEKPAANLNVLALHFTDGTGVELAAPSDSENWTASSLDLFKIAGEKTIATLEIHNQNTDFDVSIRAIELTEIAPKGAEPLNAISTAQDAIILMDGIEIERPSNKIDDLIPGVTLNVKTASENPVNINVQGNNEAIKDAVIKFVGSYNRLMAELNVLTRTDERVINELDYLNEDERGELKEKLGTLSGDASVQKLRADLIAIMNAAYETSDGPAMLANFGISTDARRAGISGYDPARLRGYMEIDENVFDEAVAENSAILRELMGRDTDGDLIVDSGMAFSVTQSVRPFTEVGGIIAGKTSGIDTRIAADNRRIEAIDRQLARKEADLRRQYGQMEDAYNRMERMSSSLENFGTQNSNRSR